MRLTKERIWLIASLSVIVVLGVAVTWMRLIVPEPVPIEIGADTTYITGPVNADGTVNYVAYVNAQLSEGVTPENNAAVILARAIGPELLNERIRERAMKLIGLDSLPDKGDYFVTLDDHVRARIPAPPPAVPTTPTPRRGRGRGRGLGPDPCEIAERQLAEALQRPWSAEEFAVIAGWLEVNAKPLALVAAATKRTHIYIPLLSPGDPPNMIALLAPELTRIRSSGDALVARAMLKLAKNDIDGARGDLMTVRKLARLIARGGTMIEGLVAIGLEALACKSCGTMAATGKLSPAQLQACLAEWEALPPLRDIRDAFSFERLMCLDAVMMLSRLKKGDEEQLQEVGLAGQDPAWVDWNELLRITNRWNDKLLAPLALTDPAERDKRLKELDREMDAVFEDAPDSISPLESASRLVETPGDRRQRLTEAVSRVLMAILMPCLTRIVDAHDAALMRSELLLVATGLALHEAETGQFPARLADLAPKYVKTIPPDRFSGKTLVYKHKAKGCIVYSVGMNLKDDGGSDNDDIDEDDIAVRFKR